MMRSLKREKYSSRSREVCPEGPPLRPGQLCVQSSPQSSGRTTRLLSTDVSRVSQSYIHCAEREGMFFLDYSKRWVTSIADNSEWRKAASSSSVGKLKLSRLLSVRTKDLFTSSYIWSYTVFAAM